MPTASLFGKLPSVPQRLFLPADFDPADWSQLEAQLDRLDAAETHSADDLEDWLFDQTELADVVDEAYSRAFIAMTVDTADEDAEKRYLHFVEEIIPKMQPRLHALNRAFLESPYLDQLPQRYALLIKRRRNALQLFREENVPLEAEEAKLDQQHDKLKGAQTAEFDGRERTLIQIGTYLERTDRDLRRRAFETINCRRLEDRERLEEIFDRLVDLRFQRAHNAGFDNFRDFQFRRLNRFDYTPEDCVAFHQACEEHVMPAVRKLARRRAKSLGVDPLRPWDLSVDPEGLPPLEPFKTADELVRGGQAIFDRVDPELGQQFGRLVELGLLDLENRKGKAPGGYQATLDEHRVPFIFMNAVGLDRDLRTLLHEAGHAFHTFAACDEPMREYRSPGHEFAEVASMSMELLANQNLDEFYDNADARRSRLRHLEGTLDLLPWIATIDAFQHWLYTHEGHTREDRRARWLELRERFGGIADWTGYEEENAYLWQRQGHLFGSPFYYIEYGIAQLGALGVWRNAQKDPAEALAAYRRALALGGSVPLPELFEAANLKFDFGPKTVGPLVEAVMQAIDAEAGEG